MLQNLCKEYCIMKVQSTFIQHLVVSQDIFLGIMKCPSLDAKGEKGSEAVRIFKLINYHQFSPPLSKLGCLSKIQSLQTFLQSIGISQYELSWRVRYFCRGISGKFYSGARPVLKTGVRPTNQTLQPKNQTNQK